MDAIWLKIKADLRSRRLVAALITLTIAAASMLLTLALATLVNMDAPYERTFEALNGAHLWLYFDRQLVRRRDIERIAALPEVVQSTGVQYSVNSRVRIGNTRVWVSLRVIPESIEDWPVNRLWIEQGRGLQRGQLEALASKDLNDLYHLQVGDRIGITRADGKQVELPVIGLAYNPMWDTYRNTQPPYVYLSADTLRALYPEQESWDRSLGLRLADPEATQAVLTQIEAMLRPDALVTHTDWHDVRRAAVFGARINFIFLGAFSLFAIVAAVLVITNNISSTVLAQFRQIGVLKAVGFVPGQIVLLYVGEYVVLAAIGTPIGLAAGIVLSPLPLKNVAASLSATFRPPWNLALVAAVLTAVPLIVILATLTSAYRGARANIIKAMAVGAEPPRHRPSPIMRLATALGLPMTWLLGLNDVFARPWRSFLTTLNLALGVIGIVFGLTLSETLDTYRNDPSLLGIVYDAVVTRGQTGDAQTRHLLSRSPDVEAFYGQVMVDVETADGRSFQVRAVEGNLAAFPFRITQGRFFAPGSDEAIAGQGLLDWLGLSIGDPISVQIKGEHGVPVTWRIVGQYPEPVNTGQMLMVDLSSLARRLKEPQPHTYYLKLSANADTARLKKYLEPRPDADLNLALVGQAIPGVVIYLQMAIFALAAVVIGIALVNVFNTSLLTVHEKMRTVGMLKTVGMTPAQVITMIGAAAGFLGVLATLVGVPAGFALTRTLLATFSRAYGFGQVQVVLNPLYALGLLPLMVAVSVLGSWLPGRRAAGISIVDVLRHE